VRFARKQKATPLISGPSAGSDLVAILKGDRYELLHTRIFVFSPCAYKLKIVFISDYIYEFDIFGRNMHHMLREYGNPHVAFDHHQKIGESIGFESYMREEALFQAHVCDYIAVAHRSLWIHYYERIILEIAQLCGIALCGGVILIHDYAHIVGDEILFFKAGDVVEFAVGEYGHVEFVGIESVPQRRISAVEQI
jgi:hypothetical protein